MTVIKLSTQAYCKMLLHAAKYPHCAVNGLLVAEKLKRKEGQPLIFVDCIPLFHGTLALAPMLEVALSLESNIIVKSCACHLWKFSDDSSITGITRLVEIFILCIENHL
uniref:ER membrane protein complex subunit 8 n=1 Tax=Erpetoichthys calabaricus TaxID=27687 RepID=A0A8C4XE76_ERPCA